MRMMLPIPKIATGRLGKSRPRSALVTRTAPPPSDSTIKQPQWIDDEPRCLMIGDSHGFSHRRVSVQACVLARRHRDVGKIFAGGAEVMHMALSGEGVISDGGEMAPRFFPVFIAVANRVAG